MSSTLNKACEIINVDYTHILEFGVYRGGSVRFLREKFANNFKIFGFDSFEGLPEDWIGTKEKKGYFSADGVIPSIEGVKFFKGWFTDTLPEYLKEADNIALLHIDCDLYSSTRTVLYSLTNYIKSGTVLVFDEWYYNFKDIEENRQHEQKAFYEWSIDNHISYTILDELECEKRIIIIK